MHAEKRMADAHRLREVWDGFTWGLTTRSPHLLHHPLFPRVPKDNRAATHIGHLTVACHGLRSVHDVVEAVLRRGGDVPQSDRTSIQ